MGYGLKRDERDGRSGETGGSCQKSEVGDQTSEVREG
jgi:hypothetical protein